MMKKKGYKAGGKMSEMLKKEKIFNSDAGC